MGRSWSCDASEWSFGADSLQQFQFVLSIVLVTKRKCAFGGAYDLLAINDWMKQSARPASDQSVKRSYRAGLVGQIRKC